MMGIVFFFITLVALSVYKYLIWNYQYFVIRNVPHIKPEIGFGNIRQAVLLTKPMKSIIQEIYMKFQGYKYCGFFSLREPVIIIRDLDLVKNILIRDFKHFHDIAFDIPWDDVAGKNLFAQKGESWKILRGQLSPGLSSTKLKNIFTDLPANRFMDYILHDPKILEKEGVNITNLCQKFSVDSAASSIFSINIDEYSDGNSEFRKFAERVIRSPGIIDDMRLMLVLNAPKISKLLGLRFVKKDVGEFFSSLIKNQIDLREKCNGQVKDYLEQLREIRKESNNDFTITHMAAHTAVFLVDVFETSAMAMSYTLFEIASHPDIMTQLQNEIDETFKKHNNKVCFELYQDLKFLECTILESLRLHPSFAFLRRRCVEAYKLPPVIDKGNHAELEVEPGTLVYIPANAIMRDPEYYPEPNKFDPNRFNNERKGSIPKAAYLVFGEGPRQCLGMRYAMNHMKIGIASMLRHFNISVHGKTIVPLQEDPNAAFFSRPIGGIRLKFNKRTMIKQ